MFYSTTATLTATNTINTTSAGTTSTDTKTCIHITLYFQVD